MIRIRTAHTSDLDAAMLGRVRDLLDAAFDGHLDDHDWEHALGGVHALLWDDEELIGHASVVQRRMVHQGRALRTGYVEGVAIRADRKRRGYGGALMAEMERVVEAAYDLGALASSEEALSFYLARGWQLWRGPTSALTPDGVRRTPDEDGAIYVWPIARVAGGLTLDLDGELTADWRDGDLW